MKTRVGRGLAVTRSNAMVAVIAVVAAGVLSGCSKKEEREKPLYIGIPSSCAKLAEPALQEIQAFAGKLYKQTVEFQDKESSLRSTTEHPVRVCDLAYWIDVAGKDRKAGQPAHRAIRLEVTVDLGDDPVRSAEQDFEIARRSRAKRVIANVGDEAYEGRGPFTETVRVTAFRMSNAIVEVFAEGTNTVDGLDSSDVDTAELQTGATSIATALANNVGTILPRK